MAAQETSNKRSGFNHAFKVVQDFVHPYYMSCECCESPLAIGSQGTPGTLHEACLGQRIDTLARSTSEKLPVYFQFGLSIIIKPGVKKVVALNYGRDRPLLTAL